MQDPCSPCLRTQTAPAPWPEPDAGRAPALASRRQIVACQYGKQLPVGLCRLRVQSQQLDPSGTVELATRIERWSQSRGRKLPPAAIRQATARTMTARIDRSRQGRRALTRRPPRVLASVACGWAQRHAAAPLPAAAGPVPRSTARRRRGPRRVVPPPRASEDRPCSRVIGAEVWARGSALMGQSGPGAGTNVPGTARGGDVNGRARETPRPPRGDQAGGEPRLPSVMCRRHYRARPCRTRTTRSGRPFIAVGAEIDEVVDPHTLRRAPRVRTNMGTDGDEPRAPAQPGGHRCAPSTTR